MKKVNLVNALELAKETLAQLSDQELQHIAGGTQDNFDEDGTCLSSNQAACNTSSCPQGGGGQPK